ncbi:hypothetical protein PAMP_018850 [Pampus punctatissimus]
MGDIYTVDSGVLRKLSQDVIEVICYNNSTQCMAATVSPPSMLTSQEDIGYTDTEMWLSTSPSCMTQLPDFWSIDGVVLRTNSSQYMS